MRIPHRQYGNGFAAVAANAVAFFLAVVAKTGIRMQCLIIWCTAHLLVIHQPTGIHPQSQRKIHRHHARKCLARQFLAMPYRVFHPAVRYPRSQYHARHRHNDDGYRQHVVHINITQQCQYRPMPQIQRIGNQADGDKRFPCQHTADFAVAASHQPCGGTADDDTFDVTAAR